MTFPRTSMPGLKRYMLLLLIALTPLFLSGCIYSRPEYSGRVSETGSDAPIAKANVTVSYMVGFFDGRQGDRTLRTVKVKTDKDGNFVVPAVFTLIPPLNWAEGIRFRIDKWGYTTFLSADISECLSVGCDTLEYGYAFDQTKKIIIGSHSVQLSKIKQKP